MDYNSHESMKVRIQVQYTHRSEIPKLMRGYSTNNKHGGKAGNSEKRGYARHLSSKEIHKASEGLAS